MQEQLPEKALHTACSACEQGGGVGVGVVVVQFTWAKCSWGGCILQKQGGRVLVGCSALHLRKEPACDPLMELGGVLDRGDLAECRLTVCMPHWHAAAGMS